MGVRQFRPTSAGTRLRSVSDFDEITRAEPERSLMEPLLEYIERVEAEHPEGYVTVVLPEFIPARWWQHLFHNQRALLIKGALLFRPNTVVTSVPFHLAK